ncbi:agmatine deiminase family protein [Rhodocaloribacter sp.]
MAAEWEPVLGAMVGWPLIVPERLVVEIARAHTLYVLVAGAASRARASATFRTWGIDPARVVFVVAGQGPAWAWPRDWGPSALFTDREGCRLVDHRFVSYPLSGPGWNGSLIPDPWGTEPYVADDRATTALAAALDLDTVSLPLALTGGNFLVDGRGSAFSTHLLRMENRALGWTDEDLARIVREKLGVSRHVILPNYEARGIQHLDCALKLIDEETLLVLRVPENHAAHPFIEAMIDRLKRLPTPYGRPYTILRIDSERFDGEQVAAYTNALILNRTVLVPLYGIERDEPALRTWRAAMPGYTVIGFENDLPVPLVNYTGWQSFDALHCRVRAVWDPEMLYMAHRRLDDPIAHAETYRVEVTIRDYSRAGLIREKLCLRHRRRGEAAWQNRPLEATGEPDVFAATLSGFAPGETVEYHVSATDRSGRTASLPGSAPHGHYAFSIAP